MMRWDLFMYALHNMWGRKLRSFLTIISVVIGIAAITALVSFGYGISSYVDTIAQQMGNDKLIVQPRGFGFGPAVESNVRLNDDTLNTIDGVHGVAESTGVYYLSAVVEFSKKQRFVSVWGMDFADHDVLLTEVYSLKLAEGSLLRGSEKNKVMLGANYLLADKVFPKPVSIRNKILVNNYSFEVAGVYQALGNPEDDRNV
ncbi:MAG: ABC transporter permease, partial [Nanoarchaeota archaeon]|nr:ABC transporter permease [Nanoarchaeota archaeon]